MTTQTPRMKTIGWSHVIGKPRNGRMAMMAPARMIRLSTVMLLLYHDDDKFAFDGVTLFEVFGDIKRDADEKFLVYFRKFAPDAHLAHVVGGELSKQFQDAMRRF